MILSTFDYKKLEYSNPLEWTEKDVDYLRELFRL